jgi:hypothetical protein
MAGFRRRKPAVSDHQLRLVPACLVGQVTARRAQGRIRQSAPAGAGTWKALLSQHRRGVQTFNNDLAVSLSQSCGQDVQVMSTDIIDPAMQPGNLGGALTVLPRTFRTTRPCPADMPQLFQCSIKRARVLDPMLDRDPMHRRVTQQSKELAAVPIQRRPDLGDNLVHRDLFSRGPRSHPRHLPIQISFLISRRHPRIHGGPTSHAGIPSGFVDENQPTRPPRGDRQQPSTKTSDTRSRAQHRCAQPTPPDSYLCSYNTPPTTTDHSHRNS